MPEVFEYQFEPDVLAMTTRRTRIRACRQLVPGRRSVRRLRLRAPVAHRLARRVDRRGGLLRSSRLTCSTGSICRRFIRSRVRESWSSAGALPSKILFLASGLAVMRLYEHEWNIPWPGDPRLALGHFARMVGSDSMRASTPCGSSSARPTRGARAVIARSAFLRHRHEPAGTVRRPFRRSSSFASGRSKAPTISTWYSWCRPASTPRSAATPATPVRWRGSWPSVCDTPDSAP